ncbi:MAG TPA: bifunctional 2-keto-4-hydroxyglutarate aldolase/2-keto-3-deoxy-6-phosphogluconate aldolase [Candidatus Izemoplasmatales bacterium]|nr:bifunctional 2-keto-4-hydroxyglutarate aldolase/2-keto-3-deoxy-6-phosphogluconate aldolase [Candidatus Izemoplasmatales bacterium]
MDKLSILKRITDVGVVAVVRAETPEEALKIGEACIAGGLPAIEVTFTVPDAPAVIAALAKRFSEKDLLIGAGTVLDAPTARAAILAGAQFVVSPGFDMETAKLCGRYQRPYLPGCLTPTEMIRATEAGCDIIKLFPGSAFGPAYVKAVRGPLPQIKIMPTGGVSLDNVSEWIRAGVVAVGVGGELTAPAKQGDFAKVTALAKAFVAAVAQARG